MQELILYIQPQLVNEAAQDFVRVDLMEAELITLTQVIQDVKDFDKTFTDYSRTFNLPASKTNNKIFKYWYNPDVIGFDNQIMASAIIELNHLPFKEGKIKLESVVMKSNKPSMYKVTFFGNTISFKESLGEDQLSNLTWLNNFNHINTNQTVKDGLTTGLDTTVDSVAYNDAIIYPLIGHSNKYNFSLTTSDINNISRNGSNTGKRGIFKEDLKPAINAKLIFKAIEDRYNLKFKTNEFLDSTAFDNLYLWLHRNKGKMISGGTFLGGNNSFSCASGPRTGATVEYCSSFEEESVEGLNYFDLTTGVYNWGVFLNRQNLNSSPPSNVVQDETLFSITITPYTGYETVLYDIELTDIDNNFSFIKSINNQGAQTLSVYLNALHSNVSGAATSGFFLSDFPSNFWTQATEGSGIDEKIIFKIISKITAQQSFLFQAKYDIYRRRGLQETVAPPASAAINFFYNDAIFTSTSNQLQLTDGNVLITEQMPKMKIIDFINTIFKMFNLTAYTDENNEILIKTLDSYYSSGDVIDISKYVVTDKNTIDENIPYTNVNFKYEEAKTILAATFKNINNKNYGELEYATNAKLGSNYEIKIPFEHMLYERISNQATTSESFIPYQQGTFIDVDNKPTIGKPLLFYGVLRNDLPSLFPNGVNFVYNTRPTDGSLPSSSGSSFSITQYWMPSNSNTLGTATVASDFNLNFGSEINSYQLTDYGGDNNSLFQKFYQNYITRVFNKKTRLFKYKAILPLSILIKLSLDDKIVVGTREFTINKMTTKLQSGETELELLNEPT